MNTKECAIKHAALQGTIFVPTKNGRGVNLGPTLSLDTVEGKSKGLKMTLLDNYLFVEVTGGSTLIPTTNVAHLVPVKNEKNS